MVVILKAQDAAGTPTADLARMHGIHTNAPRMWPAHYGGLGASDIAKMRALMESARQADRLGVAPNNDPYKILIAKKTGFKLKSQMQRSTINPQFFRQLGPRQTNLGWRARGAP